MVTLTTPRLVLRSLLPRDEQSFCDLYTDAITMRHICPPLSALRARRLFARWCERRSDRSLLAVLLNADGTFIGVTGFQGCKVQPGQAEIGIVFNVFGRARGLSTEAFAVATAYAFAAFDIGELQAVVARDNLIAQRMCMKVGFVVSRDEGTTVILTASRDTWPRESGSKFACHLTGMS